jgi:hypothetical protein
MPIGNVSASFVEERKRIVPMFLEKDRQLPVDVDLMP